MCERREGGGGGLSCQCVSLHPITLLKTKVPLTTIHLHALYYTRESLHGMSLETVNGCRAVFRCFLSRCWLFITAVPPASLHVDSPGVNTHSASSRPCRVLHLPHESLSSTEWRLPVGKIVALSQIGNLPSYDGSDAAIRSAETCTWAVGDI